MRKAKNLLLLISIAGIACSAYATMLAMTAKHAGSVAHNFCSINSLLDCNYVAASKLAWFAGIPVAWWGFMYFTWMASLFFQKTGSQPDEEKRAMKLAMIVSIFAEAVCLYKAFQMVLFMKKICLICILLYLINTVILFLLAKTVKLQPKEQLRYMYAIVIGRKKRNRFLIAARSLQPAIFSFIILFVCGFSTAAILVSTSAQTTSHVVTASATSSKNSLTDAMERHFAQPVQPIALVADAPLWGNPEAAISIVEFIDFQCPFCQQASAQLKKLLAAYNRDVKLHFIHYPLDKSVNPSLPASLHPFAGMAACAAVYAAGKNKFWQFHDDLLQLQNRMNNEAVLQLGISYGWDKKQFKAAIQSEEVVQTVKKHIQCGRQTGITGTPAIYINGRYASDWQNSELLQKIIDQEKMHPFNTVQIAKD